MNNEEPNQPGTGGRNFDPQTGQPLQPAQPPQPVQPAQPIEPPVASAYTPAEVPQQPTTQAYTVPPADPNDQVYRAQVAPQPAAPEVAAPYTPVTQVNVTATKRSNRGPIIGVVALVLVALLAVGTYAVVQLLNKTINRPAVAVERLLPANALGYFSINPVLTGNQKVAMDKMREAFESQPGFKEAFAKLTKDATNMSSALGVATPGATTDVSNLDNLSSYLGGNLTVAMLPPGTDDLQKLKAASASGDTEQVAGDVLGRNVVGMVDLDFNPLNKKGPLIDLKNQADNAAKLELVETYKGMEIRKYVTGTNTVYFSLLTDSSTALVGARVEPLKSVMDQFKDNTGLKDDANFKTLSGQVPQERIAALYLNLTQIYKEVGLVSPEAMSSVQNVSGAMLMTLSAQDDGMQLDMASQADFSNNMLGSGSSVQINPAAKPDVKTLADIPTGSLGFLVGSDLKSVLQSALDAARKQGGDMADQIKQTEDQVKEMTGKDLETDILPLMGGDYVLSMAPGKGGGSGSPLSSVVFQLKLNQGDHDKALQVLDSLANKMGDGQAQKMDVAGGTFYSLQSGSPTGPIMGVTGDRLMVVFSVDGSAASDVASSVVSGFGKGIGSTDTWRPIAKHLPADSNLLGYLDLTGIRTAAEATISGDEKQSYNSDVAPFVKPFKYFLMGSATQPSREGKLSRNHTVIFMGIGK